MNKIDIACIIDDNPIFIFGAKRMMELSNFCNSFMVFKNGQEAINNLKVLMSSGESIPEIILLDINMPIMDGWQFLDEFTTIESHKLITIYIVSSSIDPVDMNRAKHYENVSNYIIKPISLETLNTLLKEVTQE
ncbi:response regulator [Winogradskyella vidalii]|uniref:response regulator n=1 Tax=Winogradskyella vidalii TaxID=2615024 RepID=UPI0015CBDCE3|nr:response regulator [Winogradskyella vidalii]